MLQTRWESSTCLKAHLMRPCMPMLPTLWLHSSKASSKSLARLKGETLTFLFSYLYHKRFWKLILKISLLIFISRDGDKMAPSVEKKIAELEMGLLHLQQNIDIPDISLTIHQTVAQVYVWNFRKLKSVLIIRICWLLMVLTLFTGDQEMCWWGNPPQSGRLWRSCWGLQFLEPASKWSCQMDQRNSKGSAIYLPLN